MAVRVRLFAALREAAGTAEDSVPAGPLPDVLELLAQRHGPVFRSRLAVSSVLVDGQTVARTAPVHLEDGSELALLPPVSGGAGG
jgi:sulfur-carrier protein